jgi:mRNA interferase RelE/StbE
MNVTYTNAAVKALRKMPASDAKVLIEKLDVYAATGEGDVKRLVGLQGRYRLRHGDWRAIFEIQDGVLVVKVAHRREIYE